MEVCFVVLNYNDYTRTTQFIHDIENFKSIDHIVIVDNHSPKDDYQQLKQYECEHITVLASKENKGYGYGNNVGMRYVNEHYENAIIFISNPDILVEEKTIIHLKNVLEAHEQIAIAAPEVNQDHLVYRGWKLCSPLQNAKLMLPGVYRKKFSCQDSTYFYKDEEFTGEYTKVDIVTGCFFAVKARDMEKIDYFDENIFLYNEEEVIASKLKELNLQTVIVNGERITHEHSVSINKSFSSLKQVKMANKSKLYYMKHYNHANALDMMICHLANGISLGKETIKIILKR